MPVWVLRAFCQAWLTIRRGAALAPASVIVIAHGSVNVVAVIKRKHDFLNLIYNKHIKIIKKYKEACYVSI